MAKNDKILITGGTGKTGRAIAERLSAQGYAVRTASRGASPAHTDDHIRFDWSDESTHGPALANAGAAYLVAPAGEINPAPLMLPFLARALDAGVRRLVLLSSSAISEDAPWLGEVHRAIQDSAPEWAVLQPSWFMQNFTAGLHAHSIQNENVIVTATENGRVGFVDAEDIAAVGARSLVDETPHNTAHLITGPEALSYADAAAILSQILGRRITHSSIAVPDMAARLEALGVPRDYAKFLAGLDADIQQGSEDRVTTTVERVTGRPPRSFRDFITTSQIMEAS